MKKILLLVLFFSYFINSFSKDFSVYQGECQLVTDIASEHQVVNTALDMLKNDWYAVFGKSFSTSAQSRLIVGTVNRSNALKGVDVDFKCLKGKTQAFLLVVTKDGDLVVAGSDPHGTAYGIMQLSRLIGVSPWEWWADCTPQHLESFNLSEGYTDFQSPKVEYRGIFINDEDWGLMPWSCQTNEPAEKGVIGPKTTARIFELLLRLRANLYWPPMHDVSYPFFMTKGNREVAEKFGIYVGTSHCEPMASNSFGEWHKRGNGDYNYLKNREGILQFWTDRVKDVANQEIIYTLGLRGIHDGPMEGAKTAAEQKDVLVDVLRDQRAILKEYVNKDVKQIPQVFIPYKEVLEAYKMGLQVPDDITLMWCDDNYGFIRHFPTAKERKRKGGNGVYYHVSYWGRPHDYLWLGAFSPSLLFQQMGKAYDEGIQRMWVLNVGDIKPAEYQIELFMDMAWNIDKVREQGIARHLDTFLAREFGEGLGHRLGDVMREHYRLAFICRPEFLGHTRTEESDPKFKIVSDMPWGENFIKNRLADYRNISDAVQQMENEVPQNRRTAFFHLVRYPVQAATQMNEKMLTAQLARHGKAKFHNADLAYDSIVVLTARYNQGKWKGIMDMHPRELSVFDPVQRVKFDSPLTEEPTPLYKFNGLDATSGSPVDCYGLGYEGKAAEVLKGETIGFDCPKTVGKTVKVELRLLPNHPMEDNAQLRVAVDIDGKDVKVLEYQTQGRSETWKLNILRNQAIVEAAFTVSDTSITPHLNIKALDKGVVVDQVLVW